MNAESNIAPETVKTFDDVTVAFCTRLLGENYVILPKKEMIDIYQTVAICRDAIGAGASALDDVLAEVNVWVENADQLSPVESVAMALDTALLHGTDQGFGKGYRAGHSNGFDDGFAMASMFYPDDEDDETADQDEQYHQASCSSASSHYSRWVGRALIGGAAAFFFVAVGFRLFNPFAH